MNHVKDDRGFNQVWGDSKSTRIRAERRCDHLISKMEITAGKSVMEIGCGTGRASFMLAKRTGLNTLGTDLCVSFIDEAKKNYTLPNLRYAVLDFNRADQFNGEKFDYIIGDGIMHHLYDHLDEALANMRNLLRQNGKILFFEPNIYNPYIYFIFSYPFLRKKARLEPGEMAFSAGFIAMKLLKAGYKNIQVEHKDFLLPGIPAVFIRPSIVIGRVLEKMPLVRKLSQSIYFSAQS